MGGQAVDIKAVKNGDILTVVNTAGVKTLTIEGATSDFEISVRATLTVMGGVSVISDPVRQCIRLSRILLNKLLL